MDVTTKPFQYASGQAPEGYKCGDCGATNVKLWRYYQTFLNNQHLRCMECACKHQEKPYPVDFKKGDQIGWMVPAVPTEEGNTYWGYTSVPQDGVDWWKGLKDANTSSV